MLFIVSGRDHANGLEHRLQHRPAHRAYYNSLGDDLILAGPYVDDKGDPVGSMIVMRRKDLAEAEAFANADPFVTEGVFESHTVARWDWLMKRPDGFSND